MSGSENERARLGKRLRAIRKRFGMTENDLASRIEISQSKLSKIERGKLRPSIKDVDAFANALELDDAETKDLIQHTKRLFSGFTGWDVRHSGWSADEQDDLAAQESSARDQRLFQDMLIPGLLQTREYAKSVLTYFSRRGVRHIRSAVEARLRRQEVLYVSDKTFCFVLSESSLRNRVCSTEIMVSQLSQLKELSKLKNVSIGIVPWTRKLLSLPMTNFLIFDRQLVLIETLGGEVAISDDDDIERYSQVFANLKRRALFGADCDRHIGLIQNDYVNLENQRKTPGMKWG